LRLALPVEEVQVGVGAANHAFAGGLLDCLVDDHELIRLRERQRLQDYGIHHGENGRVGADAEREGKNCDGGEAGGFAQYAKGVAKVLKDAGEKTGRVAARRDGLAMKFALDGTQTPGEQVVAFEFFEGHTAGAVFRVAAGEQFLIAIFEVLREFVGDFVFAGCGKFQRCKPSQNFAFPFRHFRPS
jgi:hypothetical protein